MHTKKNEPYIPLHTLQALEAARARRRALVTYAVVFISIAVGAGIIWLIGGES